MPNWIARAPPVPRMGFVAALSGVMHPQPRSDGAEGSLPPAGPGFAVIV
jgi:hypothetical protein